MSETQKHPGGAPTKYKKEYCDEIINFFRIEPYETKLQQEFFSDGSLRSEKVVIIPTKFPTFQDFADSIGVHIDTLNEWCKKHQEFSEAYARAKQLQEKIWLINGMNGQYNSQFAIFFGKNCLGYKDKQETINVGVSYEDYIKRVEDEEEY